MLVAANVALSHYPQAEMRSELQRGLTSFSLHIFSFSNLLSSTLKVQFTPKSKMHIFLAVELFINLDSFGLSCLVLEISAAEIFSNIMGLILVLVI